MLDVLFNYTNSDVIASVVEHAMDKLLEKVAGSCVSFSRYTIDTRSAVKR